ncbi:MAG: TolC family protein [Pseudobdellovibrionaceae bacterium]
MKACTAVKSTKVNLVGILFAIAVLLFAQINWAQKTKEIKKSTVSKNSQQPGMTLEQYLNKVKSTNQKIQALSLQVEAAEDRRVAGDFELAPIAGASYSYLSDQSQPQTVQGSTKVLNRTSEIFVSKKFSSGTNAKVFAQGKDFEFVGAAPPLNKYATGSLGFALSQSLWKDFFGSGTRLRQDRESVVAKLETVQAEAELRQVMTDAEIAFWNYLYKLEEKKQRQESLERSSKILNWIKRREADGIADRSDRFNSEALVSTRQLLLLNADDDLKSAEQTMRDFLSLEQSAGLPLISGNIGISRPMKGQFSKSQKILRADAYLQLLESKSKKMISEEVMDGLRPDLSLQASYETNSFEENLTKATNKWTEADKPRSSVGVQFTYVFDTSVKGSRRSAANKEAMAADLKAKKLVRESASAWEELVRKYDELSQKIVLAESIKDFQMKRAKEEQLKLTRGRSITNQVVSSEEDAANADLTVIQLKAEQRKLEAMTRNYFEVSEELLN